MDRYIFGLLNSQTRKWVEDKWRAYGGADLDGFVDEVLMQPGEHILPLLPGDDEVSDMLRKRYLENLGRAFTRQEIRQALRAEMELILRKIEV